MGQYHSIYNIDKQEVVHPHDIGLGAKQWEHTGNIASLSDVLYILTTCSPMRGGGDFIDERRNGDFIGRWVGDRCVVIGDYAEDGDIPNFDMATLADFTDISDVARRGIESIYDIRFSDSEYGFMERVMPKGRWYS